MTRYVFQTIESMGTSNPFDIEGKIVQTYGSRPYSSRFVALVELEDGVEGDVQPATEFSEGVTCAGKDGTCSRTVDKPGDYCWQHEPDEDERN